MSEFSVYPSFVVVDVFRIDSSTQTRRLVGTIDRPQRIIASDFAADPTHVRIRPRYPIDGDVVCITMDDTLTRECHSAAGTMENLPASIEINPSQAASIAFSCRGGSPVTTSTSTWIVSLTEQSKMKTDLKQRIDRHR